MGKVKEYPKRKKISGRKAPVTWILVADGREAQIYMRPASRSHIRTRAERYETPELIPVLAAPMRAEPVERELGRHALPRVFESQSSARHMAEPRVDLREETRKRFVREIANELQHAWADKAFERLVLIAPAKVIGELRKALPAAVSKAVIMEVDRDLTHCPVGALSFYLNNLI